MLAKTYRIETERLVIRCYQPKDAVLLKKSVDDSLGHLLRWIPWAKHEPEPLQNKITRIRKWRGQFDLGEDYTFGIFNREETVLIGSTGLHTRLGGNVREIGYWIHANHLRQGYALETVKALSRVGFDIEQLERIQIHCAPHNLGSKRIPEKLGYTYKGIFDNVIVGTEGNTRKAMIWILNKDDYATSSLKSFAIKAFDVVGQSILL